MKPKTSSNDQKQKTKTQKQEIRPSTINTLAYQGLFQNGLMQVSPSYFSQTYLLGDINYQTVGLDDKGAIVEKYSDLINSLDDKTNFQLTIFNQKVNLEKFRKSILYPLQEDGFDAYFILLIWTLNILKFDTVVLNNYINGLKLKFIRELYISLHQPQYVVFRQHQKRRLPN